LSSAITFWGGDYYFEKAEPYYYQGLSYLAVGKQKEAKIAFESAVRIAGDSGFGAKAKVELPKIKDNSPSSSSSDFDNHIKKAEQGNPESQFRIGCNYFYGEGVKQDYTKSKEWFSKSAAQGFEKPFKQYRLLIIN
jgi:TPR repeat protein